MYSFDYDTPSPLQHPELELFYSTPTRYIDAVYEADLEWTVKTDDFFPYADHSYAYWTGEPVTVHSILSRVDTTYKHAKIAKLSFSSKWNYISVF